MRVMFKTIIVIFFAFIIFITQANENVSDDKNLIAIVKQYYKAIEDVRQENAKESDVKKLVQLLSDGFKYEHPKFGAYGNRQEKQQVLTLCWENSVVQKLRMEKYQGFMSISRSIIHGLQDYGVNS